MWYPLYLAPFWFEFLGNFCLSQAFNECAVNKHLWYLRSQSVTLWEVQSSRGHGNDLIILTRAMQVFRLRKMSVGYSFLKNHLKVCIRVYSCSKKNCVGHFSEHNNDTSYKRINCLLLCSESALSWRGYFRKVAKNDSYLFQCRGITTSQHPKGLSPSLVHWQTHYMHSFGDHR